jgi:hypothetical protein
MPRAARRRLIVAAAAIVAILFVWLVWIGYFKRNAIADSYLIRQAAFDAYKPVVAARSRHELDDATFWAAEVRAHQITPLLNLLDKLADERTAHPWSIAAAYRYHHVRGEAIVTLEQLQNFRDALPSTTRATP